jgi:hypothetical protein
MYIIDDKEVTLDDFKNFLLDEKNCGVKDCQLPVAEGNDYFCMTHRRRLHFFLRDIKSLS